LPNTSSESGGELAQSGFVDLEVGVLAVVLERDGRANRVRKKPNTDASIKGKISEHAVLAILRKPKGWKKGYPYDDGVHVWRYVRGRTKRQRSSGRFKVVQGWTAASENGEAFLGGLGTVTGCRETLGTELDTHLEQGQQAYVLPADRLNVREEADPHSDRIGRHRGHRDRRPGVR
jgi:hypothetical protein